MKIHRTLLLAALVSAAAPWAAAQGAANAATQQQLTTGEVRKVDASQGKVTLRHEAITYLDMPSMTMVFRAAKPELLQGLKVGDKVQFRAENPGGTLTVTSLRRVE